VFVPPPYPLVKDIPRGWTVLTCSTTKTSFEIRLPYDKANAQDMFSL